MEDFVIISVKNFSYAQNYQNWKDVESFMFFSLYMYTNNTNSLIIVGAQLTKTNQKKKKTNKQTKKQRVLCTIRFFD